MANKRLIIEIANKCNNNCIFCRFETKKIGNINFYLNQIDIASKRNVKSIDFRGGEPTLYPGILKLIKFARKKNFEDINLFSNGRIFYQNKNIKPFISAGVNKIIL